MYIILEDPIKIWHVVKRKHEKVWSHTYMLYGNSHIKETLASKAVQ